MKRLEHLDGLRGVAILLVVAYHAYSRWIDIEPWPVNQTLDHIFGTAWLGVELFFVISGFVIIWSLEKTKTLSTFIYKRWLRLFPAMLLSSLVIYGVALFTPERPQGEPNLIDFLPGVLFIDPQLLTYLFGEKIRSLDAVFWSLYVEVQFYLIIAFSYFFLKDKKGYIILFIFPCFLGLKILKLLIGDHQVLQQFILWSEYLNFGYFGWFACGICYYHFYAKRGVIYLLAFVAYAILSSFQIARTYTDFQMIFVIHALMLMIFYWASFHNQWLTKHLSSRFWVFLGFISYPLYLIHQNIVTGLAIKLYHFWPGLPGMFYPILPLTLVVALAYGIAQLEPLARKSIEQIFSNQKAS